MKAIQQHFSISDLEKLSGIKAHTIRIWEKRYNLLQPKRSDSNIRKYDMENLQELLNISLLVQNGYKISKIAQMDQQTISKLVENTANTDVLSKELNQFQKAMLQFDIALFESEFQKLIDQFSFKTIFLNYFIPLLKKIGVEWQIAAITPAHEHFISNQIRQKVYAQIDKIQSIAQRVDSNNPYILYLPEGELHDIGLLFIHCELLSKGKHSIYLGNEVPIETLLNFRDLYQNINYISYFTINPSSDSMNNYLKHIEHFLLRPGLDNFHLLGLQTKQHTFQNKGINIHFHSEIQNFISMLNA